LLATRQRALHGDLHQVIGVLAVARNRAAEAPQSRQQADEARRGNCCSSGVMS
jgi:hypothetical protein